MSCQEQDPLRSRYLLYLAHFFLYFVVYLFCTFLGLYGSCSFIILLGFFTFFLLVDDIVAIGHFCYGIFVFAVWAGCVYERQSKYFAYVDVFVR